MRQGDWDEIVQHPERPLTRGQIGLLREQNIAALNCERRSALCLRLIIEVDRLSEVLQELVAIARGYQTT